MEESPTERRSHKRYDVNEKVMLYNGTTFAEVNNISEGGVLCRFLIDSQDQLKPVSAIDLISAADKLFIQKIPCRDLNWHEAKSRKLFGSTSLRECRLKFKPLDDQKHKQLRDFIQTVSTDESSNTATMNSGASEGE